METIQKKRGVLLGYFPPENSWNNPLTGVGVPETEPHITILYFGSDGEITSEQITAAKLILRQFAISQPSLQGSLNGVARFDATTSSDGKDVIVRLADVPGLETLREELRKRFSSIGLQASSVHGYVPHTTLTYVDPGVEVNFMLPPQTILIDNLTLSVAGEKSTFPFAPSVLKHAPAELQENFQVATTIAKVDLEKQLVFGWASVSEIADTPLVDLHGDIIGEADMEAMAYDFVLNARVGGEMHTHAVGTLVESLAFTKEKQAAMGISLGFSGWWVGFHIENAEAWEKVKRGEYAGFSIGGVATREAVTP